MITLKDKIIVITGGAQGLGKALAQICKAKGAVVIISDINKAVLEKYAEEIHAVGFLTDVSKEQELVVLKDMVIAKFGKIDIWINNAGLWLPRGSILDLDMKRVHTLFEVNVFGLMHGSRVAVTVMTQQEQGMIVNIISTSALEARSDSAAYCASKHAAKGFTDSMREELKDTQIKIVAIYPGGMKTELFNEKKPDNFDEFMAVGMVAEKIIANLELDQPLEEMIMKRPGQK